MVDIAKLHDKELQDWDIPMNLRNHKHKMKKVLTKIKVKVNNEQEEILKTIITKENMAEAISKLQNGKAADLNGLTLRFETAQRNEAPGFDVTETLMRVFQDIKTYSIIKETNFAEGWMCPIYKKGNKTDIGNYHPIIVPHTLTHFLMPPSNDKVALLIV